MSLGPIARRLASAAHEVFVRQSRPTWQRVEVKMSDVKFLKRFAGHAASFFLNFAHGSLLVAGVLVVSLVAYQYAAHGVDGLNPRVAFHPAEAEVLAVADGVADASPVEQGKLSPEYTRLVQYLAKRYKVSATGLEQLVWTSIHEGRATKVDPVLILAVTSVESGFNPLAESVFGAQGLMQIIPRFHQDKIDSSLGAVALLEPTENIRVGARILREYMRNNGALEAALQQYGGVSDASDMTYAAKVLNEVERFRQIMKFGSVRAEVAANTSGVVPVVATTKDVESTGNPG
ncbi:lytic transglycosylase domain-containing protein [Uliginosibacterium sp. H3]|uniref:Lytic transglycosylase domain-containing protein n=1 Tax=Uliginosibacterium silvisoli TaxID=3114758 RepID=A0ABU6K653_9RHOO|nr:lytic transglycosylase domain-containing protein [Uliginosibacterium sp. H3]